MPVPYDYLLFEQVQNYKCNYYKTNGFGISFHDAVEALWKDGKSQYGIPEIPDFLSWNLLDYPDFRKLIRQIPDGECIASINFGNTEPVEYRIPNTGAKADQYPEMKVCELGYTDMTKKLEKPVSGIHDLYLVFRNPDIRLSEIQID